MRWRREHRWFVPGRKSYVVSFEGGARAGNVAWEATATRGDTDTAFARDDVRIMESSFRVGRQNHASFGPRAVIAVHEDGRDQTLPFHGISRRST
jgi:hypothetical protein